MDYIVSVTLVNNNWSCTTVGPGLVIITVWWSLSESSTTLDRLMTSDKLLEGIITNFVLNLYDLLSSAEHKTMF